SPKRSHRTKAVQRANSPASCNNVIAFPVTDGAQTEATAAPYLPEIQEAIDTTLRLTPLQLLAVIIKAKLRDRIKDEEVHLICQVYYDSLESIIGESEE